MTSLLLATLLLIPEAFAAAENQQAIKKDFVETRNPKGGANSYYDQLMKTQLKNDEEQSGQNDMMIQSSRNVLAEFNNRVRVPGFISATPLPQMARIVGPVQLAKFFRAGDTVFVRWSGAPMPRPGDRFSTFTPAIVIQNLRNPSEFSVILTLDPQEDLPKDTRLAGYFYETTGRLRVMRVKGGLVEATVEQLKGQMSVGDELMAELPKLSNITPINSGIQLSAAVICGSPHDRLSTTKRSFIYINRGSRDGIRVGRVFESIETVQLDQAVGGAAPQLSNGEAIVVHTTDSYSTAMITKQFDVIRMGSLLRTTQEATPTSPMGPFEGFKEINEAYRSEIKSALPNVAPSAGSTEGIPTVPNLDKLPGATDESLPEPRRALPDPQLSELDSLERSMRAKELTPAEKARLGKLSQQEKMKAANLEELEEDLGAPGAPALENSFKDPKKKGKNEKKTKKKAKNDEEELNQLMMEN